jgi:SagB-type dehydrogenase family enzyme
MFELSLGGGIVRGAVELPARDLASRIIERLRSGRVSLDRLEAELAGNDMPLTHYLYVLQRLCCTGLVDTLVTIEGRVLAVAHRTFPPILPGSTSARLVLSRFASLRSTRHGLLLETPFSQATLAIVSDEAWQLCRVLSATSAPDAEAESAMPNIGETLVQELLLLFDAVGALDEPDNEQFVQWEHHDALFHARTRGRSAGDRGGTYRFLGTRPPAPAIVPSRYGAAIGLEPEPASSRLASLEDLFDRRRSVRAFGDRPMFASQLATLLTHVARMRSVERADVASGRHYDTVRRAYPSGGACHELELYPVVHRCEGIAPGMYWYDAACGVLRGVGSPQECVDRLLSRAGQSMGIHPRRPDILVCIAARFDRVNWKYEGIAYSTILKNVGVLMATMDLVGTAMGLATCAIGCGDSALLGGHGNPMVPGGLRRRVCSWQPAGHGPLGRCSCDGARSMICRSPALGAAIASALIASPPRPSLACQSAPGPTPVQGL